MPWNHMQLEISPADLLIRPMYGPGGYTRKEALAEVQSILDRAAGASPQFRELAAKWKAGAKDDTVFLGLFTWTVYEYQGEDPLPAAMEWIEDYAQTMRGAGVNVQVGRRR